MKKLGLVLLLGSLLATSGCQSLPKDKHWQFYIVGAGLSYAIGKYLCDGSGDQACGAAAAAAFVYWY